MARKEVTTLRERVELLNAVANHAPSLLALVDADGSLRPAATNRARAWVRIRREGNRLVVVVEDDGIGGADPFGGTGLRGLGHRLAALDGDLGVESPPGAGTHVRAEIPLGSGSGGRG